MVEDLEKIYNEMEQSALSKSPKGEKADKIRAFVKEVAKKTKKDKLVLSALYRLAKKQFPDEKIDRSHFASIIEKTWQTEKDDTGIVRVLVNQEKKAEPKAKA